MNFNTEVGTCQKCFPRICVYTLADDGMQGKEIRKRESYTMNSFQYFS